MYKSCSRCGRVHDTAYICPKRRTYGETQERKLRNKYSWAKKSQEIRSKADYLCEVCRQEGIYTYNNLECHHITKLKDNPEGLLDNENVICLCQYHHKLADAGEIDAEYLEGLAKAREERID